MVQARGVCSTNLGHLRQHCQSNQNTNFGQKCLNETIQSFLNTKIQLPCCNISPREALLKEKAQYS
jgi:hypothetical protein